MALEKVGVQAVVEGIGKYIADMGSLNKATAGAADATEKAAKQSDAFEKALKNVGKAVAALGLAGLFGAMIKSASDSEQAISALNNVLKSTGGAAGVSAEAAQNLANALQKTTRYSDETVLSVETMLLRFKGMSADILPKATKAVLDIATAMGIDTGSAAKLLGKLMQDPIGAMGSLTRAGVKFTDATEKQVKALVKSGKLLEAQKYLLDQVTIATGGAAEAAGNTFAGKLDILKNAFDNVLETVGGALLPILTDLVVRITGVIDALGPAAPVILAVAAAIGVLTLAAGPLGVALGIILSPIGLIIAAVGLLAAAFATNFGGIRTAVEGAVKAIAGPLEEIRKAVSDFFTNLFSPGGSVNVSQGPGGYLSASVASMGGIGDRLASALAGLGPQIKKAIEDLFASIGIDPAIVQKVVDLVSGPLDSIAKGIKGFIDNLSGTDFSGVNMLLSAIGNGLSLLAGLVGATVLAALDAIGKALPPLGTALKDFINAISALAAGDTNTFLTSVSDGINKIGEAANNLPVDLAEKLGGFLGIDVEGGLAAWGGVRDSIGIIIDEIKQRIEQAWTDIQTSVNATVSSISSQLSITWNDIQTTVTNVMTGISNAISGAWNGIVEFVTGIVGSVRTAFANIAKAITDAVAPVLKIFQDIRAAIDYILGHQGDVKGPSGGGGKVGGHAKGGPFGAMETILVGEKGPELVTFAQGGFVIPNNITEILAQIASVMAVPVPAPALAGNSYTNNNNQRTMGDVVFQGVPGAEDAMRRFAMLRALGRV